jgi:hypothetical protein
LEIDLYVKEMEDLCPSLIAESMKKDGGDYHILEKEG